MALATERTSLAAEDEYRQLAEKWHNEYWAQHCRAEDAERQLRLLHVELREAQDAARTYHEAWQDAAIYWKEKLAEARDVARNLLEIGAWGRVQQLFRKKHPWLDDLNELSQAGTASGEAG